MLGMSTVGIIVSLFVVLNIISVIIILAACVVSGRAARAIDPHTEAKLVNQRELAIAVSKLRVINPQPATVPVLSRHVIFSSNDRRDLVEPVIESAPADRAIAPSRA